MNVHNLMEEIVISSVDTVYEQVKSEKISWLSCDCENCRLDTVSYVLNRVPPKYVVSGRGVTHASQSLASGQLKADLESLIIEGMRTVSSTKRPYHNQDRKAGSLDTNKPAFNFFTLTGTVLDGNTFEPLTGATITLKKDGKLAEMVDVTWSNPYTTVQSTKGAFSFWVKPVKAKKAGESKVFDLSIEIEAPDYEPLIRHFEVPVTSEATTRSELDSTYAIKLNDLVLFKKEFLD